MGKGDFNTDATVTGRLSGRRREPGLQNIPIRPEEAQRIIDALFRCRACGGQGRAGRGTVEGAAAT